MADVGDMYYRYEDILAVVGVEVHLRQFTVVKTTPKGVWIDTGRNRFVLNDAKRKYAYPTREDALHSFKIRKLRQVEFLEEQVLRAKLASALVDRIDPKNFAVVVARTGGVLEPPLFDSADEA